MKIRAYNLGRQNYKDIIPIQKYSLASKKNNNVTDDYLYFVEYNPVITIGRSGNRKDILVSDEFLKKNAIDVVEVERGGKVTCHGPGQIVAYPIFDLKKTEKDVHKIIRKFEDVVIDFLTNYNITGKRIDNFTGVWVDNKKLSSIGIAVSSWITYHGISINITDEILKLFSLINPCGLSSENMTSITTILKKAEGLAEEVDIEDAIIKLKNSFAKIFRNDIMIRSLLKFKQLILNRYD